MTIDADGGITAQMKQGGAMLQKGEQMLDIKEYLKQTKTVLLTQDAFDELKQRASAQPEIIRCKDCKHFWLGQCGLNGLTWSYDSFCSMAERREE